MACTQCNRASPGLLCHECAEAIVRDNPLAPYPRVIPAEGLVGRLSAQESLVLKLGDSALESLLGEPPPDSGPLSYTPKELETLLKDLGVERGKNLPILFRGDVEVIGPALGKLSKSGKGRGQGRVEHILASVPTLPKEILREEKLPKAKKVPPPPPPEDKDALLAMAEACLEDGRHDEALRHYNEVLGFDPTNEEAWFDRAEVLAMLGRKEEAADSYDRVLSLNPKNKVARVERANLLYESGQIPDALRAWTEILSVDPGIAGDMRRKARGLINEGKAHDALLLFNCLVEGRPSDAESLVGLADALLAVGDVDRADEFYRRAIEADPTNAEALYKKGKMLDKRGRWGAAIQVFNRAIAVNWNYPDPWLAKAEILMRQEKPAEALECYTKILRFGYNKSPVYVGQARALNALGRGEDALTAVEQAIEQDPENEEASSLRLALQGGLKPAEQDLLIELAKEGVPVADGGKYTQGLITLLKQLKASPRDGTVWTRLAEALLDGGYAVASLPRFEHALLLDEGLADAWCGKGIALYLSEHVQEAQECFARALALDPAHARAKKWKDRSKKRKTK